MDIEKILHEIDERHQFSNEALVQKRFDDYINIFSDNLIYKQLNGKIIDKNQLTKDISSYFSRLKIATSHYERKDFSIEGNRFTETMIQKATASIRIFFFFLGRIGQLKEKGNINGLKMAIIGKLKRWKFLMKGYIDKNAQTTNQLSTLPIFSIQMSPN